MRVVLDVNVWISALLWGGVPGRILRLARNQQITIFASEALFLELETSLRRDKFQPRLQAQGYTVEYLIIVARGFSEFCPTTSVNVPELRDPDDARILATASAANAKAIVTGDQDLLTLNEFEGIPIMTPTDFLKHLG